MVTFVYIESRFQNDVTSAVQTIKPELFDFPNSNLSRFGEDVIFGSDLDVLQEVIVEDEAQYDINVDGTSSASPASLMNDVCSNENSMSSFATSETHNRFWTREEDFRSEVLPENFFNETDDDPSFNMDPTTLDQSVSLNEESGFVVNNLFPIKEEVGESDAKFPESTDETLKKAARRRTKQELTLTSQKPKYGLLIKQDFLSCKVYKWFHPMLLGTMLCHCMMKQFCLRSWSSWLIGTNWVLNTIDYFVNYHSETPNGH